MDKITLTLATSIALSSLTHAQDHKQSEYYARVEIPTPKDEVIEVGSLALMPNKQLAVATRRGDVWIVSGAYEKDLSKVKWKKVFDGAHEPLGMFEKDGWLHFTDRDAYARIGDKDKNGTYETYEIISNKWGISGDYHEYNFGSTPDKNGDVWVTHCLTGSSRASAQWRGWAQRISPDGTTTPIASGVRSPGGIGFNHQGDVFYTDNQGLWNGTSCLKHLKPGHFTGNPTGNKYYKDAPHMGEQPLSPINQSRIVTQAARIPQFVPPAVQIPHGKVGQSPTAIITDDSKGKFGPFSTQLLIGEQTHSQVNRIFLEKVNGVYQGAVWKMLNGFRAGIVPMRLSDDGTLFVGGTNRGWASTGGKRFTLERVRWTGKKPFEMEKMEAVEGGFKVTFTEAIDFNSAIDPANISCEAWTYIYQKSYGSPEVDKLTPKVTFVGSKSGNDRELYIQLDKLTQGHIHHLNLSKIKSKAGKSLWHPNVYYTLNQLKR